MLQTKINEFIYGYNNPVMAKVLDVIYGNEKEAIADMEPVLFQFEALLESLYEENEAVSDELVAALVALSHSLPLYYVYYMVHTLFKHNSELAQMLVSELMSHPDQSIPAAFQNIEQTIALEYGLQDKHLSWAESILLQ